MRRLGRRAIARRASRSQRRGSVAFIPPVRCRGGRRSPPHSLVAPNTAVPATSVSAPASMMRGAVSGVTPPSTDSAIERPEASIIRRRAAIFGNCDARNSWPPNPGLTVITRTMSTRSSTHAMLSGGVAGFSTTPARLPCDRISWSVRCRCGPASGCTSMWSAPASANAAMKGSTGAIIRCTSNGNAVCGRRLCRTGGPKLRFGTKCPSITSRCSQSAPAASTAATSSRSRAKSAARMLGATVTREARDAGMTRM